MDIVGLTGGIASGKSSAAMFFKEKGLNVVDADLVYRKLVAAKNGTPTALVQQISQCFGAEMILENGELNRASLGARVFSDDKARQQLGAMTHPAVAQASAAAFEKADERGEKYCLYDVPLLFERGIQEICAWVIVVWVPRACQLERLIDRDGIDRNAAQARIDSQMSLDEKRERADVVIDNQGSLSDLKTQVDAVYEKFLRP